MAALTCISQDGKLITDGTHAELTLRHGATERQVAGLVRAFETVERVLDEDGYAIGKVVETRWEIATGDPHTPAIGFLPENVITRSGT